MRLLAFLAVVIALAACSSGDGPGDSLPGTAGADRIAFVRSREGSMAIYTINADGSGLTKLTDFEADTRNLAWSPDGKRVALDARAGDDFEFLVMSADGTARTKILDNPSESLHIAWSPDGGRISFVTNRGDGQQLFVINPDGSGLRSLGGITGHVWSPDGKRIATEGIDVVNADGSGRTRITDIPGSNPNWSPDGERIVFVSSTSGPSGSHIYLVDADGTGLKQLTNEAANDTSPLWSPDGKRIAFFSDREDATDYVFVMNADGTDVRKVGNTRAGTSYLSWSPDSTRVAFVSDTYVDPHGDDIIIAFADGSGETQLTLSDAADSDPTWLP